jgi:hypothetical protein
MSLNAMASPAAREPVAGSVRLSLTRGTVTSIAPALVSTSRGS